DDRHLRLTSTGAMLGTPAYAAPEQVEGEAEALGPATDVYGLGVVLYELLTGRHPFEARNLAALVRKILYDEPAAPSSLRPGLDRRLERICLRMLAKRPQDRYARMGEVEGELATFLRQADATAPTTPPGAAEPGKGPAPAAEAESRPEASGDTARG